MDKQQTTELEQVVIRFSGDSGDGMQLVGTMFSNISAILGNEISTFPDYPAEIRAPQGTVGGVSGFQVHLGASSIHTPGDDADILVAMNPAALKVNAKGVKRGGVIIFDTDSFTASDLEKAGFTTDNPFEELDLSDTIQLIPVALSELTKESLKDSGLDNKSILRSKNMFALGLICWLFNRPMEQAIHFLENKFKRKPGVLEANVKVLTDGYNYGNNAHLSVSRFVIDKSHDVQSGRYTSIAGNTSAAYGLIAAAVFWGSSYVKGLVSLYQIALFIGGVIFIIIEILTPTIGLLAGIGVVAILYSLILAMGGDINAIYMMAISLVIAIIIFAVILKKLPSSRLWKKLILTNTSSTEQGYVSSVDYSKYLNKEGVVLSELRPSGSVEIDGVPVDVVSEGKFISKGEKVRVVKIEGVRIIVRRVE